MDIINQQQDHEPDGQFYASHPSASMSDDISGSTTWSPAAENNRRQQEAEMNSSWVTPRGRIGQQKLTDLARQSD
jgi:hypothetical protein